MSERLSPTATRDAVAPAVERAITYLRNAKATAGMPARMDINDAIFHLEELVKSLPSAVAETDMVSRTVVAELLCRVRDALGGTGAWAGAQQCVMALRTNKLNAAPQAAETQLKGTSVNLPELSGHLDSSGSAVAEDRAEARKERLIADQADVSRPAGAAPSPSSSIEASETVERDEQWGRQARIELLELALEQYAMRPGPDGDIARIALRKPVSATLESTMNDERTALLLGAISTAAVQNTRESAKQRIGKDNPYYTAAYGDVCDAVDREMALREEGEHLRMQIGYIVTELMLAGDKRSMPEIVEAAAEATKARADRGTK